MRKISISTWARSGTSCEAVRPCEIKEQGTRNLPLDDGVQRTTREEKEEKGADEDGASGHGARSASG
jgi:hypothetical protein